MGIVSVVRNFLVSLITKKVQNQLGSKRPTFIHNFFEADQDLKKLDIVFVHGLNGHPENTWLRIEDGVQGPSWPRWLGGDFPEADVWSVDYQAAPSQWIGEGMPLTDRATNILALLNAKGINQHPIIFIAHSLGGLLVKQMLRIASDQSSQDEILKRTLGVVFMGTPHTGSDVAKILGFYDSARITEIARTLSKDDAQLRDLNFWYRDNSVKLEIETLSYYETQETYGQMIVDRSSADPGLPGMRPIGFDFNHVDLCKIDDPSDERYLGIKYFVKKQMLKLSKSRRISVGQSQLLLDVSVENDYPPIYEEVDSPRTNEQTLLYKSKADSGSLVVVPHLGYLDKVKEGGFVNSVRFANSPFRWLFPTLDFKIVNNSQETVLIQEAIFEVKESQQVNLPVLVIKDMCPFCFFTIYNEGWADAQNCKLNFNIVNHKIDWPPDAPFKFTKNLGTIGEGLSVDLSEELRLMGVRIDELMRRQADETTLGPFEDSLAMIVGTLGFEYNDGTNTVERSFSFSSYIELAPPSMAAYAPSTYTYSIKLDDCRSDYTVSKSLSQVLKPGEADRFQIVIMNERSAMHDFGIRLRYNNHLFLHSVPIALETLVPRCGFMSLMMNKS